MGVSRKRRNEKSAGKVFSEKYEVAAEKQPKNITTVKRGKREDFDRIFPKINSITLKQTSPVGDVYELNQM